MSAVSTPYGLIPIGLIGGRSYAGATREIKMTTNSANGIFTGDIITMALGQPAAITATPTTTLTTTSPVGVCVGVSYTDPVLKYTVHAQFLPAGAVTAGYTNIRIKVVDDPDVVFKVQASGSVAYAARGLNAQLTNFSAQSTVTGNSKIQLLYSSPATTNTFGVKIIDFTDGPLDQVGDAYTECHVIWNQNVHTYRNILAQ